MFAGRGRPSSIVRTTLRALRASAAIAVLAGVSIAAPAQAEINLRFGVYTADKPTTVVRQFRPALDALETHMSGLLGVPVTISMQVAPTYEKGVAALVERHVDFARFGPASYVVAKDADPDIQVLAIESKKGEKQFNGVICVRTDSEIQTAADLVGRAFAFGDENSTIGRYLSQRYLAASGITASKLSRFDYLGRHDLVGAAVARGQYDAGALKESTFKKLVKSGMALRAIAKFPNVTKPWIARSGLPANVLEALKISILALDNPEILKALKKDGFLEGSDDDFDSVRDAISENAQFFRG